MTVSQAEFITATLDANKPTPDGLIGPNGAPAGKRFDVYRNNVAVSLTEALISSFPVIYKLVGDEWFRAMAGVYLRNQPPQTPLIKDFGAEMPRFLRSFEPAQQFGYLPHVARLECAMRVSYHAADVAAIDPAQLGALSASDLMKIKVEFAPSMALVRSRWPIFGIWAANMKDGPVPQNVGENVLITRPEFDPMPVLLPAGAATFIEALQNNKSFGVAFEAASRATPEFDLGTTLGPLIHGAAITKIHEG